MYDASNRRDVRAAEKALKHADSVRRTVLVELCSTANGRQWIWQQLEAAHIFSTTFAEDARQSAFLEGERNAGLRLLNDIMAFCPDAFITAMREHNERSTAAEFTRRTGAGRDAEASADAGFDDTGGDLNADDISSWNGDGGSYTVR